MKAMTRILSVILCAAMLLSLGVATVSAAPASVTGAVKTDSASIKIGDTDTGVTLTQMLLEKGSKYSLSADGLLNVVEVNLSDKVTMAVLNGGDYNWSKATMGESVVKYNNTHSDATVLAAVNGDPWIVYHTDYDGDGVKATGPAVKHVSVSRGTMIIDGELWASHQINDENNLARNDNAERGTPASRGPVFGIKNDGTAMIGTPTIGINLINVTDDKNIKADGINRLPAPNSVILYNQRCGTESFAFEDAYEIYLECEDAAFGIHKFTNGKVVAIFESGDKSTRPAIDEKTVVISARGSSISRIKGQFDIGDIVSVFCSVSSDAMDPNQATVWGEVKEAIAGFFTLMQKGQLTGQPGNATNYPCSIIGMKADGTVLLISTTATVDGTRDACQMQNLPSLCKELGLETAILFDGGGSTTMVSLSGNKYVRRSAAVDGNNSVRSVISGIAVVYKGVDKDYANAETKNTAYLTGLGLATPEEPDTDGADLKVAPAYTYGYLAQVETVNGREYDDLIGRRDPNYAAGWSAEEKAASIQPAVLPEVMMTEDGKLILSGWALVNGGQSTHYWSLDKEHWYQCVGGECTDAEQELLDRAGEEGKMTLPSAAKGRFANLTADLSDVEGDSLTVYFAVASAGAPDKLLHYLTVEKATRLATETEAPTEEASEALTEILTEAPSETTAEPPVFVDSLPETQPASGGCSSAVGFSAVALLTAMATAVALRKRKH